MANHHCVLNFGALWLLASVHKRPVLLLTGVYRRFCKPETESLWPVYGYIQNPCCIPETVSLWPVTVI